MTSDAEQLSILYQDEHLVVVDKPSGLLVHRTAIDAHETRFAVQILRRQLQRRVFPVHRLDKATSGVLLFALDPATARATQEKFAAQQVEKTYLAIVRGHPPEVGCIDYPLRDLDEDVIEEGHEAASRPAVTRYRRLATIELPVRVDRYPTSRYALLELHPRTGRRHQLRRHLKHLSHPIIGDAVYGKGRHNRMFAERFGCGRLLLASVRLELAHPITRAPLRVITSPAADFLAVVDQLDWRAALSQF